MDNGTQTSPKSLPLGHQDPQHRTHLAIADSEPLVFLILDVIAVESKIEPDRSASSGQGLVSSDSPRESFSAFLKTFSYRRLAKPSHPVQ